MLNYSTTYWYHLSIYFFNDIVNQQLWVYYFFHYLVFCYIFALQILLILIHLFLHGPFFLLLDFFFNKIKTKLAAIWKWSTLIMLISFLLSFESNFAKSLSVRNFLLSLTFISVSLPFLLIQKDFRFSQFDKKLGDFSYPTYIVHFFILSSSIKIYNKLGIQFTGSDFFWMGEYLRFLITLVINIILSSFFSIIALRFIAEPVEILRNKIRGKNI
jgi:peptidoglycan/LPS O-acetylase OafA/YrhL